MRNAPVAVAALEAVDVATAERLEERARLVAALLVSDDLALDEGGVAPGEVDDRVADDVHGRLAALAHPAHGVLGEVDAQAHERAVIVGGIRVVHAAHELDVEPVDASAVLDQPPADGALVEQSLHIVHRRSLPRRGGGP